MTYLVILQLDGGAVAFSREGVMYIHGTDGWLVKFDKNICNFTRMEGVFQREVFFCSGHV